MNKKQFLYVLAISFLLSIPVYHFYYNLLYPAPADVEYQTVDHIAFDDDKATPQKPCDLPNKEYSRNTTGSGSRRKVTYVIEIDSLYTQPQLNEIADYYAAKERCENVFVEFYLTTQDKSGMNYALVHRTSTDTSTVINYTAPETSKGGANAKMPFDGCKIYGKWDLGTGGYTVIYQKNNKHYMCNVYNGATLRPEPELFYKTTYGQYTAFINADDSNDMYAIQNGRLVGYFEGMQVAVFNPIK